MQSLLLARDVDKKKNQTNLAFPDEMRAAFDEIAKKFSAKEKWMVAAAGILLLIQEDEETQRDLVAAVAMARHRRELPGLIEKAEDGKYFVQGERRKKPANRLRELGHGKIKSGGVTRAIPH